MKEIEIKRRNCIHGWWKVPDTDTGEDKTIHDMAQFHISEVEGREGEIKEITFTPENKKEKGGHGISGTVRIKYSR